MFICKYLIKHVEVCKGSAEFIDKFVHVVIISTHACSVSKFSVCSHNLIRWKAQNYLSELKDRVGVLSSCPAAQTKNHIFYSLHHLSLIQTHLKYKTNINNYLYNFSFSVCVNILREVGDRD